MAFSKPQLEVYNCPKRFRVLITGRRFGKTHLDHEEIQRLNLIIKKLEEDLENSFKSVN